MTETIIQIIVELVQAYPWFPIVTSAVTLASAIAAATPTPKAGTVWSTVYKVIDVFALNIGKAKNNEK
jgi:hypothetical protein